MIHGVRQKVVVGQNGKSAEQDTTEYLLSTEANRKHLTEAIEYVEKRENLIVFTPEEWNERQMHNLWKI